MTKKEKIIEYIKQHPNCTSFECQEAVGCCIGYVRQIFHEQQYEPPCYHLTARKYLEGETIGEFGVFFKKRLEDSRHGIFICPYCGKEFVGNISGVGKGLIKSCGCYHKKISRENTFIDITGKRFGKLVALYCLSDSSTDGRAIWHCRCDCGNEKDVSGKSLRSGHVHSCGCSNSKGEALLRNILDNLNISFISQKKFDNFVAPSGRFYQFDFYLPDYHCCIEYDGEQHYTGWRGNKDSLEHIKKNDAIKDIFCLENNLILVRIPYFYYDNITLENISKLLEELKNEPVPQVYTFGENKQR